MPPNSAILLRLGEFFSPLFSSIFWMCLVKEISVKTLVDHKLKQQWIQRPCATNNTKFMEIV